MGRRHRSVVRRRSGPGHFFRCDARRPIRPHVGPGHAEEDHLRRLREVMPRKPDSVGRTLTATERIVPLDRARTFITLLVVLHHSVVNYTYFANGDRMRWLGFDLVGLFNDSFFMACMFFISRFFLRDSLARRGPGNFLASRAWR